MAKVNFGKDYNQAIEKIGEYNGLVGGDYIPNNAEDVAALTTELLKFAYRSLPEEAQAAIEFLQDNYSAISQFVQKLGDGENVDPMFFFNVAREAMEAYTSFLKAEYARVSAENDLRRWGAQQSFINIALVNPPGWLGYTAEPPSYLFERPRNPIVPAAGFAESNPRAFEPQQPGTELLARYSNNVQRRTDDCDRRTDYPIRPPEGGIDGKCHGVLQIWPLLFPLWRDASFGFGNDLIGWNGVGQPVESLCLNLQLRAIEDPVVNFQVDFGRLVQMWDDLRIGFNGMRQGSKEFRKYVPWPDAFYRDPNDPTDIVNQFREQFGISYKEFYPNNNYESPFRFGIYGTLNKVRDGQEVLGVVIDSKKKSDPTPNDRLYWDQDQYMVRAYHSDRDLDTLYVSASGNGFDKGGSRFSRRGFQAMKLSQFNTFRGMYLAVSTSRARFLSDSGIRRVADTFPNVDRSVVLNPPRDSGKPSKGPGRLAGPSDAEFAPGNTQPPKRDGEGGGGVVVLGAAAAAAGALFLAKRKSK